MNVLYFCGDSFAHVAAVSILSLLENNKSAGSITIYVIDDGITDGNKEKMAEIVRSHGRGLVFLEAPDPSVFFEFPFKSRYQIGRSYMRMCIGGLLPEDVDKLLCLDSDTLVVGDLSELWETDMGGNVLAGVADCVNLRAFRRQFMLDEKDIYCNAGVYLVNLNAWRKHGVEDEIRKVIREHDGNVFFFEQTLMNYVSKGRIMRLPAEYNCYTLFFAFEYRNLLTWRRPTRFYTEEEVRRAVDNPKIIHYTRNFYMMSRPWVENCSHPMKEAYLKYKAMTPWKETEKDGRSWGKKLRYKLIHGLPQSLVVRVADIMYNTIRPLMVWKNE